MSEIYYEVMRDYTTTVHYNVGVNNSIYHFHQQLELLYVEQGEVEVTINDKKQTITKGQLVIADSFYNHQFLHKENSISHCLIIPVQYLKKTPESLILQAFWGFGFIPTQLFRLASV